MQTLPGFLGIVLLQPFSSALGSASGGTSQSPAPVLPAGEAASCTLEPRVYPAEAGCTSPELLADSSGSGLHYFLTEPGLGCPGSLSAWGFKGWAPLAFTFCIVKRALAEEGKAVFRC